MHQVFDDSFISENGLTKGTMKLIFEEDEFKKLLTNLKIENCFGRVCSKFYCWIITTWK